MKITKEHTRALNKAKVGLMSQHNSVFITTILFSLKFRWSVITKTAATDGIIISVNPNYFMDLEPRARVGLLAHEAWHPAFNHPIRGIGKQHERYNKAADYVINIMLKDEGYTLPPNGLCEPKYRGMSTDQIYDLLPEEPENGDYNCDIKLADTKNKQDVQNTIQDALIRAKTQSKMANEQIGTIPGEIEVLIDKLLRPKLDWKIILRKYMSAFAKNNYTYNIPNRRFFPDWYLPSLRSENLNDLAEAFDASISVSDEEFGVYISESKAMRKLLKPLKTTLMSFDTKVQSVHTLNEYDNIDKITFNGRGGTSLFPVFEYFNKHPPTVLIVFSDLQCRKIQDKPKYPVIWICVNNPNATVNFGKLIHYNTKGN